LTYWIWRCNIFLY